MTTDEKREFYEKLREGPGDQPFSEEWLFVDNLSVDQAAHLWCGFEPRTSYNFILGQSPKPQIAAIKQMLIGAIEYQNLPAKKEYSHSRADGGAFVSREDLKALAESKKLYPAFLFNTDASSSDEEKNKGGKPPEYNWDKIRAGVIFLEGQEELPEKLNELAERMISFVECGYSFTDSEHKDRGPAQQHMEKVLRNIYNEFKKIKLNYNEEKTKKS